MCKHEDYEVIAHDHSQDGGDYLWCPDCGAWRFDYFGKWHYPKVSNPYRRLQRKLDSDKEVVGESDIRKAKADGVCSGITEVLEIAERWCAAPALSASENSYQRGQKHLACQLNDFLHSIFADKVKK